MFNFLLRKMGEKGFGYLNKGIDIVTIHFIPLWNTKDYRSTIGLISKLLCDCIGKQEYKEFPKTWV